MSDVKELVAEIRGLGRLLGFMSRLLGVSKDCVSVAIAPGDYELVEFDAKAIADAIESQAALIETLERQVSQERHLRAGVERMREDLLHEREELRGRVAELEPKIAAFDGAYDFVCLIDDFFNTGGLGCTDDHDDQGTWCPHLEPTKLRAPIRDRLRLRR